jgi:hypothetical protein
MVKSVSFALFVRLTIAVFILISLFYTSLWSIFTSGFELQPSELDSEAPAVLNALQGTRDMSTICQTPFEGDGLKVQEYNCTIVPKTELRDLAFLIRAPYYSPGRIERFKRWIRELKSVFSDVDVWIMSDVSKSEDVFNNITADLNSEHLDFKVFTYQDSQMIEQFPDIVKVNKEKRHNVVWLIPLLNVQYWWNHVNGKYHHVWAMEDDTDYCGSIAELVEFYEKDPEFANADVLSAMLVKKNKTWSHFWDVNPKCSKLLGENERYFTHEHIQRYSNRFLNQVWKSGIHGIHAQSEMFTPSFCLKLASAGLCEFKEIKDEHVGEQFAWHDRLSREELKRTCEGKGKGKLFHAMKW